MANGTAPRRAGDVFLPAPGTSGGGSSGKIFGINKWIVIGAIGIGLVIAYVIYRRSQSSSSAATTASSASGAVDPNAVDPATGLTYGEEEALAQQSQGQAAGGAGSGATAPTPTASGYGNGAGLSSFFQTIQSELAAIQAGVNTSGSSTPGPQGPPGPAGAPAPAAAALPSSQTTLPPAQTTPAAATLGLKTQVPGTATGTGQVVGGSGGEAGLVKYVTPTQVSTAVSAKAATAPKAVAVSANKTGASANAKQGIFSIH